MPQAAQSAGVLPLREARRVVEDHARKLRSTEPEPVALLESFGRVLAEDIVADRDFPPFPRATRDGYAVRSSDLAQLPAHLKVVGEIPAGVAPRDIVQLVAKGEAAEIMTGAPAPNGADAIVMVEYTTRRGETVEVTRSVVHGENIVPPGAEARAGDILLRSGARMTHAAIAVAASVGKTQLIVRRRPRVAILSTGDELVDVAATPGRHQIRNSNSYSLAAQVIAAGGMPVVLPIAPDEPERLRRLISDGLKSDLLLLTGGVSAGKYDLVEDALRHFDAEFHFTGALIQPGKPVVFGRATAYFFGLPGNPVSTMVTFDLFVRPMLDALSGAAPRPLQFTQARLRADINTKTGLTRFLPAVLSGEFEQTEVELARWQGSGDIAAAARANCYIVVPPDRERIPAGEMVSVLLT